RVFIAPELSARLDERALHAALEHEMAHARHRDPLRLWLAQIATDLQWPLVAAQQRFTDWRNALELARDAEACERVEGSDLAAAPAAAAPAPGAAAAHQALDKIVAGPDAAARRAEIAKLDPLAPAAIEELGRWVARTHATDQADRRKALTEIKAAVPDKTGKFP